VEKPEGSQKAETGVAEWSQNRPESALSGRSVKILV
jgi:hypothetical protein